MRMSGSQIANPRLVSLPQFGDSRGNLVVGESEKELPFVVRRLFIVRDVPSNEERGMHAHKLCHQFLICVSGSVSAIADNGLQQIEVNLDSPTVGLYMPPLTWGKQFKYSEDAVLLVLASDAFDESDYIHNYDEFLNVVAKA